MPRTLGDRLGEKNLGVKIVVKPELIIFDMDGLMFDTEKIAFISWRQAAFTRGYKIDEDIFIQTVGTNLKRTKEIYLKHFGDEFPIDEIIHERFAMAESLIKTNGVPIKSGLNELLEYLGNLDIKKAVATSTNRERAFTLLEMAGIVSHFDYVLCGDEVKDPKPNPEIFLRVAEKLGCHPKNCYVLEDSELGVVAAHRAGMIPIIIPDMRVPNEKVRRLAFRQMSTLYDVKAFFKTMFEIA